MPIDTYSFIYCAANSPVTPDLVPAFSTLNELGDKMGQAISDFTGIDTTVGITYSKGSALKPGSLVFDLGFRKSAEFKPSFNQTISFGDFGTLGVEESYLSIGGSFSFATEFGVVFKSDDTQGLVLLGSLRDDNCTTFDEASLEFSITWRRSNDVNETTTNVTIDDCSATDRLQNVRAAISMTNLNDDVNVTLVGGEYQVSLQLCSTLIILTNLGL